MARAMPVIDKKWEEERLARTLAEAKAIMKDPKKMAMARAGAKRQAEEKTQEARAMRSIARAPKKQARAAPKSKR